MKYFAISQDGCHNYITKEIANTTDVNQAIEKKKVCPHWYLSVSGVTNKIDCNPAAPLFIYGAIMCSIIVDENKTLIYSSYTDSKFCNEITARYIENFTT